MIIICRYIIPLFFSGSQHFNQQINHYWLSAVWTTIVTKVNKKFSEVDRKRHQKVIIVLPRIMQQETGSLKTMPAPSYIPLNGQQGPVRTVHNRGYRHQYPSNHYNRTKRKRDSSSGSNGYSSNRSQSPGTASLPPWGDPLYPYTKGIIG